MRSFRTVLQEARREEQYGNLPRAIELYRKALRWQEKEGDAGDPTLYNRLGDLYLRAGEARSGVECYVKGVDRLEAQGLHSAAIALCKKILRNAPDRIEMYRWTGRLQARAGLRAEARESYIDFANRMERAGDPDRAFEALAEFAELSDDEGIRLALADRFLVADRVAEAVEELRQVWRRRTLRGEDAEEIRSRIAELHPEAELHLDPADGADGEDGEPGADEEDPSGVEGSREAGARGEETEGVGPDIAALTDELQAVLSRLEGEEKLRQAIPLIDRLLGLEPHQIDLVQRKLTYALGLGDEEAAVEAYRQLGEALEARVSGFEFRFLSTHSAEGAEPEDVQARARPALAPSR